MPKTLIDCNERVRRFRGALALRGMTYEQFAEQQGVTKAHLSMVVRGIRESKRLSDAIDAFADHTLSTLTAVA